MRETILRLALVAAGTLAGLALLELALQLGALYNLHAGRRDPTTVIAGRRRILTLGDSNTYGLYVPPQAAYPRVLERLWNAHRPDDPIEVLNFAFPGMNSSRLRRLFPELVETVRPDLVLVMIGANDVWTVPEPTSDGESRPSASQLLWHYSRVYRLFFMLARAVHPPHFEMSGEIDDQIESGRGVFRYGGHTFEMPFERLHVAEWGPFLQPDLSENLRAMVEDARRADVEIALLTYPAPNRFYSGISGLIRRAAGPAGVRLIEVAPALAPACAAGTCPELFDDGHPTIAGHRRVARYLVHVLARDGLLAPASLTASRRR